MSESSTPSRLSLIISVLEGYADWYGLVMRRIFYPEADNMMNQIIIPKSFAVWREFSLTHQSLDISELDRITKLHKDLHAMADRLVSSGFQTGTRPDYQVFNDFANLFDDFLQRLRRVEVDYYLSDRGFDSITGLRNPQGMAADIARELERVTRKGRAFSLVMFKVHDIELLKQQFGDGFTQLLTWIGQSLFATIRTFDDGYRLNDAEFLVSLKHADIQGAHRFVDRLQAYFSEHPLIVRGIVVQPVLSFVIAEPLGEESVDDLVAQLRRDLASAAAGGDVVRHEEASPLQRFLKDSSTLNE